ncbi:helix-turn-helix domain-containing protein [Nitrospira sp. Kam-Ns4a]
MSASLGEWLKRLREERGLSLEGIAQRTRIHQAYLRALEENDFTKLPPALLFAKAYVKAYARCLALSEQQEAEVMLRFVESARAYYNGQDPGAPWLPEPGYRGQGDGPARKIAFARVRLFR